MDMLPNCKRMLVMASTSQQRRSSFMIHALCLLEEELQMDITNSSDTMVSPTMLVIRMFNNLVRHQDGEQI